MWRGQVLLSAVQNQVILSRSSNLDTMKTPFDKDKFTFGACEQVQTNLLLVQESKISSKKGSKTDFR